MAWLCLLLLADGPQAPSSVPKVMGLTCGKWQTISSTHHMAQGSPQASDTCYLRSVTLEELVPPAFLCAHPGQASPQDCKLTWAREWVVVCQFSLYRGTSGESVIS
jgi:hypothetical protein